MKQLHGCVVLVFVAGLFLNLGLKPVLAAPDGSAKDPIPVPADYSPAPVTEGLNPGETAAFVSADGKEEINSEREALDHNRLGLHYRTADGKLWKLAIHQTGIDKSRVLYYHFEPVES